MLIFHVIFQRFFQELKEENDTRKAVKELVSIRGIPKYVWQYPLKAKKAKLLRLQIKPGRHTSALLSLVLTAAEMLLNFVKKLHR